MVEFLLRAGARIDVTNSQGKTAVQLGSFVGQHACVRIVKNFIPLSMLEHYTIPHGKL